MITKNKYDPEWYLQTYTTNLTEKVTANPGQYVVIGRDKEIKDMFVSLGRKTKNNPILIGEAGVGKTAIVESFTKRIIQRKVPDDFFNNKVIYTLELSNLTNTGEDGDMIYRIKNIINALEQDRNKILFIDEIHTIAGAGAKKGALDAGNVLKPALSRGTIQLIGATTLDEYHQYLENDKALERRFQTIMVNEPTSQQAYEIMNGLKSSYEKYHNVQISNEAIKATVNLAQRYDPEHQLPDKAIDLLDEACSQSKLEKLSKVDEFAIAQVLEERTGIPVANMLTSQIEKVLNLDKLIEKRVKGQHEAVEEVTNAIRIQSAGLKDPTRPIASFIFLGTTGVGKTELAKALAKAMFDTESSIIRFDMSEYQEKEDIKRLIGTQTTKGQLTEAIRRKPYSIILFDEIEKANKNVYDVLLQILDDGRVTDALGNTADCRNAVIILTTNLGADLIQDRDDYLGKTTLEKAEMIFNKQVETELKAHFRPEFVNRIDHKVVFNMLSMSDIEDITRNQLDNIFARALKRGYHVTITKKAINYVARHGYDVKNGARPIGRAITKYIAAPLSIYMLQLELHHSKTAIDKIKIDVKGEPASKENHDLRGTEKIEFKGIINNENEN